MCSYILHPVSLELEFYIMQVYRLFLLGESDETTYFEE